MSTLADISINTSPWLPEDQMLMLGSGLSAEIVVGIRRLTEVELAGRWARWFVRKGFDDAGLLPDAIKVGPEPDADNVSLLATLTTRFAAERSQP